MTTDDNEIDVAGLDIAEVLLALHNGTQAIGMGRLHNNPSLTAQEIRDAYAEEIASGAVYVDYLSGRPLKVHIEGGKFDPRLYDRDAGQGQAKRVIDRLRAGMERAS